MEYAVNIRGLSKAYKDFSLKDVDILLPKGAIMGLIGENGAGKSTTLKAMLDIVRRDSGGVEILGPGPGHGPAAYQGTDWGCVGRKSFP